MATHVAAVPTKPMGDPGKQSITSTTSVIQSSLTATGKQEKEGRKEGGKERGKEEEKGGGKEGTKEKGKEGEKRMEVMVKTAPTGSDGIRERLVTSPITSSPHPPPPTPTSSSSSRPRPPTSTAVAAIMTPDGRPMLISAQAAAAMAASQPFIFPQGYQTMPVFTAKLGEPVPLGMVDFESKSIEITGEVPIRKINLLEAHAAFADEGRLLEAKTQDKAGGKVDAKTVGAEEGGEKATAQKKGGEVAKPKSKEEGGVVVEKLRGHTSQEVMSAKMLLSLTGTPGLSSPLDKDAPSHIFAAQPITQELNRAVAEGEHLPPKDPTVPVASPVSGSAPQTPSGGRKRKQKPTPSAKASEASGTPEAVTEKATLLSKKATPPSKKATPPSGTAKGRRGRKAKKAAEPKPEPQEKEEKKEEETPKRSKKEHVKPDEGKPGKTCEFTAQELLTILEIPPSTGGEVPSTPAKAKPQKAPAPKGSRGKKGGAVKAKHLETKAENQASRASESMLQLKAGREDRPLKEYIIETDTESGDDSDSSSSGSSSGFTPNSGSSSDDSSSDSSSESPPSESKTPLKGVIRGRGGRPRGWRGRGRGRGGASRRKGSSSDESTSQEEGVTGGERGRGRGRRRGGGIRKRGRGARGGGGRARGHIVRIPTNILSYKTIRGWRKKSNGSHEVGWTFPYFISL